MLIRITRIRPDVELPAYATTGSAAFDVAAAEASDIPAHGGAYIPTGLIIATPPGHVLILASRSSLFRKKGLVLGNGIGTIDSDYCGPQDELMINAWNPGDTTVHIEKGERLVQGLIVPIIRAEWDEGEANGQSRGGLGSSGGYAATSG